MGIKLFEPLTLSLLCLAVAIGFALGSFRAARGNDFWEHVSWGKIFVAMVYASTAALALLSVLRSAHAV